MEEKELKLILANHSLEIEKKVDDKLHKQELALRDMFSDFEKKMLDAMDIKFEDQKNEIEYLIDGHRKQCENIFLKIESEPEFVKERDLYTKTKEINEKMKEKAVEKISSQSNLIISVVKIISWFVMGVGTLILALLKLGIIKV